MNRFKKHTNCLWTRERIDSFLDAELDGDELITFQSHVDRCSSCRRELTRANRVLHELHALPGLNCPDEVVERAIAGLESTPVTEKRGAHKGLRGLLGLPVLRPALTGALVVLLAISAVWVANRNRSAITPAEIAGAEAELKWTLAYLEDISRRSAMTATTQAFDLGMVKPVQRAVRAAFEPGTPANQQTPANKQSPTTPQGGGSA